MSDKAITFLILGAAVAVFVWDHLPVAIVAIGVAVSLWATNVLSLDQSLAGFGDPTVVFMASLFVVSARPRARAAHLRPRPADLQYGDGADPHPHLDLRGCGPQAPHPDSSSFSATRLACSETSR
jgi:hypothetical protein